MNKKDCVAMILAGGQGSRLGALTKHVAKPAIPFGAKYRIIDFTLSNCAHSGIGTVGVLTQYQPLELNTYIGNGASWDLDRNDGGVFVLPPYIKAERGEWYKGTANAIYQNINFVDKFSPKYVVILSGDHIYKMHYGEMVDAHEASGAVATIAVMPVPWEETSRFGIMNTDAHGRIVEFEEKPKVARSNLASMGVYVFTWAALKKYLIMDENNQKSSNDFGKNIIPSMLEGGENLNAYRFTGYWKDVGTIHSLWEANMDLIATPAKFDIHQRGWKIYSKSPTLPPHFVARGSQVKNSCVTGGCHIQGEVVHSVLFENVSIGKNSVIKDSVIMSNVTIGDNVTIERAIVGYNTNILDGATIGVTDRAQNPHHSAMCENGVVEIAPNVVIGKDVVVYKSSMVEENILRAQRENVASIEHDVLHLAGASQA